MSHYIVASSSGKCVDLSAGTSRATLEATAETGFDLYAAYGASHLDRGMSGSGGGVEVDRTRALEAYQEALAWALTLARDTAGCEPPGFSALSPADRAAVQRLADALRAEGEGGPPESATVERAREATAMILEFTRWIAAQSETGPVQIAFM